MTDQPPKIPDLIAGDTRAEKAKFLYSGIRMFGTLLQKLEDAGTESPSAIHDMHCTLMGVTMAVRVWAKEEGAKLALVEAAVRDMQKAELSPKAFAAVVATIVAPDRPVSVGILAKIEELKKEDEG